MTFGYNNEVILLTKISTSDKIDFPIELNAQVSWFTCKDICIPQDGNVSIVINEGELTKSNDYAEIKQYVDNTFYSLLSKTINSIVSIFFLVNMD